MAPRVPDVSIVIVSFNGKEVLADCLKSLLKETRAMRFQVIVSDNGSTDGCVDMVRERFPLSHIQIIENKANLGFAAANNRAFIYCTGRYVMLLNPDTLLYSDAVSEMVRFMDGDKRVGLCGPRLINKDGSLQHSARNFPTIANQLAESLLVHKLFPHSSRFGELVQDGSFYELRNKSGNKSSNELSPECSSKVSHKRSRKPSGEPVNEFNDKPSYESSYKSGSIEGPAAKKADWVTGAALMIRREALNDTGLLDERFFMYSEEKDWCFRAREKGWPTVLYPAAEIMHLHGDSGTNPDLFRTLVHSKELFLLKNYAPYRAQAIIAIMRFNLAIRFVICWIAVAVAKYIASVKMRERLQKRLLVIRAGLFILSRIW